MPSTPRGSVPIGGIAFATGAHYVAAGATCAWRDGTSTTSAAARMDLTLDRSLALGGVAICNNHCNLFACGFEHRHVANVVLAHGGK